MSFYNTSINNKPFYFEKRKYTYEYAKKNCALKLKNGRLYEPKTWEESEKVFSCAYGIGRKLLWWIGVNDRQKEGRYVYDSDGSPVLFNPIWFKLGKAVHPRGKENNCMIMLEEHHFHKQSFPEKNLRWADAPCDPYNIKSSVCVTSDS